MTINLSNLYKFWFLLAVIWKFKLFLHLLDLVPDSGELEPAHISVDVIVFVLELEGIVVA